MPRGRILNKKISFDEVVAKLTLKSALFFTWSIPHLDVGGKILGDLNYLKGNIVPYRNDISVKDIQKCIDELEEYGLVIVYGDNHKYLKFKGFEKNQTVNIDKEAKSEIPDPAPELSQSNAGETPGKVKEKVKEKEETPHPLSLFIKENLLSVSKLEKQLTESDCIKLYGEYSDKLLMEVLQDMDNYKPLLKKYKSVNLTLRKWLKIREERRNGNEEKGGDNINWGRHRKGDLDISKYARELATETPAKEK